ncbi:MAG: thioredoxin family protein [Bacteroidales bacterium]|nr:thioredoxin family protein [Bacteroidales bacterium]
MKKYIIAVLLACFATTAFSQIQWISFEKAMALAQKDGKPLLVDVYTDWCGWCKRLDATTYQDSAVVAYINNNFHAVKFNAEADEKITYHDTVYTKKDKTHELAIKLLDGRLSYPTTLFIVVDNGKEYTAPVPGYQTRESIQPYLFYFSEKAYNSRSLWESFMKGFNAPKF